MTQNAKDILEKLLEGLMMIVPQLEGARSVGQPSVSIRKIGK